MTSIERLAVDGFAAQRSTPGLIADRIRGGILDGTLVGGQQLVQDDLARAFGTSRIPVREALRQLEADGLVAYHPHRGASVSVLTADDVREIYEIRVPLEALALRLAIPRLDKARIAAARRIIDDSEAATDGPSFGRANWRFHEILYQTASRPRLLTTIKNLYIHASRWPEFTKHQRPVLSATIEEHRRLLRACERHDGVRAQRLLKAHLNASERLLLEYLEIASGNGR